MFALDRTREWTAALTQWCDGQPDLVAFTGACQVHRAEIMQLQGFWLEAIEEARRAHARSQRVNQKAAAEALYQQAEFTGCEVSLGLQRRHLKERAILASSLNQAWHCCDLPRATLMQRLAPSAVSRARRRTG